MRLQLGCNNLATRLQLGSFAVLCFSPLVGRMARFRDHLSGLCAEEAGKGHSINKAIAWLAGLHPGFWSSRACFYVQSRSLCFEFERMNLD